MRTVVVGTFVGMFGKGRLPDLRPDPSGKTLFEDGFRGGDEVPKPRIAALSVWFLDLVS